MRALQTQSCGLRVGESGYQRCSGGQCGSLRLNVTITAQHLSAGVNGSCLPS